MVSVVGAVESGAALAGMESMAAAEPWEVAPGAGFPAVGREGREGWMEEAVGMDCAERGRPARSGSLGPSGKCLRTASLGVAARTLLQVGQTAKCYSPPPLTRRISRRPSHRWHRLARCATRAGPSARRYSRAPPRYASSLSGRHSNSRMNPGLRRELHRAPKGWRTRSTNPSRCIRVGR